MGHRGKYSLGLYSPQEKVDFIQAENPEGEVMDRFMEKQFTILESALPEKYITKVEDVPGVRLIQNMNEMGYFVGLFDIQEPIVYKVTFDNPSKVYRGHI